jgi:hypothetical protein
MIHSLSNGSTEDSTVQIRRHSNSLNGTECIHNEDSFEQGKEDISPTNGPRYIAPDYDDDDDDDAMPPPPPPPPVWQDEVETAPNMNGTLVDITTLLFNHGIKSLANISIFNFILP